MVLSNKWAAPKEAMMFESIARENYKVGGRNDINQREDGFFAQLFIMLYFNYVDAQILVKT